MRCLKVVLFFIIPNIVFSQKNNDDDKYRESIAKNIFRVVVTKDNPNSLAFQYEREIKRPFNIVAKFGPTLDFQTFGDIDTTSKKKNQYSFGLFGSIEARYYFNLNHRIKKHKAVHNFSAFYLSIEQYIASNPFVFINQKASHALQGSLETFLNIGWQKQYKIFYVNFYLGAATYRKTFSKYFPDQHIDGYHGGVGIGLAF